ncbi:uncharacterized protein LOC130781930 [Actinidia eriantha]|uniref:uncharacterized protein LOC130781930 n=1 Tax=Actinidia eriantha TaxID=165200 RepID=UPI0025847BAC|nr:uncharacterized protein LOC130781930 [Actinidia eriantha]
MDVLDFDDVKAEKASTMPRFNRLRTAARFYRVAEICLALVLLPWISARLLFVVRISGEYFRQLIAVVISPLFIFLLTNAIVVILLAKSGQFSGQTPEINNAETDLYEQFIINTEESVDSELKKYPPAPESEEIVYEDKQVISEVIPIVAVVGDSVSSDVKNFRRGQSEKLERESWENPCEKLRRSVTEKCRKLADSGAEAAPVVEELSNEDFNRTVEEFIAKQVKFHLEEKLAIVAC